MTKSYRLEQVNSLIQKELSEIFQQEGEFPEGFLVTISKVEVSKDLSNAKIFVTVYPKVNKDIEKFFQKNIYQIQQLLNKKLNMHPVPKIKIVYDRSEERAVEIEEALKKIKM
jgi:ribosome-binding factor A